MKQNAQQLTHDLRLRKRQKIRGVIPSAYSQNRRVTVEDVFHSAGKFGADGIWREGPVSVIGSGLGHRIYPNPRKTEHLMPTVHHKEYLWCCTSLDGSFKEELVVVRNKIDPKHLKEYGSMAFRTGKNEEEFVRLVVCKYGTFWVWRI
jgi:hypothetical protein